MIFWHRLMVGVVLAQCTIIGTIAAAESTSENDIILGRASILMERASSGLDSLTKAKKAKISSKWAEEMQSRAADICAFVQKELEHERLNDKDVPLCSVE